MDKNKNVQTQNFLNFCKNPFSEDFVCRGYQTSTIPSTNCLYTTSHRDLSTKKVILVYKIRNKHIFCKITVTNLYRILSSNCLICFEIRVCQGTRTNIWIPQEIDPNIKFKYGITVRMILYCI